MSTATHYSDKKFTYEYFCRDNVCRLCWSITEYAKSLENDSVLVLHIEKLIGVTAKGHILKTICYSCANIIENFSSFRKTCLETDKKLQDILQTFSLKENKESNDYDQDTSNKEDDFELKMLETQIKKEVIDDETFTSESDHNFGEQLNDEDDFFPIKDDHCYMCKITFATLDEKLNHDVQIHKMLQKSSYTCYFCKKKFIKYFLKIVHEVQCKISKKISLTPLKKLRISQEIIKENATNKKPKDKVIIKRKNHKKREKILTCNLCSVTFENAKDLRKHKVKHENSKECICEICGRVCKKMSMYDHMLIHTSYKQMKCPHCDYRATIRISLNMHIRRMHCGARPFLCSRCPYRSASSCNLAAHRRTHAALSNYTCHLCDKSYRYKVSLQDHITITHEGKKRFHCLLCGSQYYLAKSLVKHLLNKHGLKVKKNKNEFIHNSTEERRVVGGAII